MGDWLEIEGRTFVVTGGSSGIGQAIVKSLLENKANVVLADLQEPSTELTQLAEPNQLLFVKTNVAQRESVENLFKESIEHFGKIDVLVNNAGINMPRLLVDAKESGSRYELSDEVLDRMISINQKGVVLCSQIAGREMVKSQKGVIINMVSESGLEGSEGQSAYAATKAAIYSYTRSWAKELGKFNIRVVGVAPGILEKTGLRTPAYEDALAYTRGITVEQLRQGYTNKSIPIRRDGKLAEVADLVLFLGSDRASYITGTTYNIAGGKSRG
ncbi:SDR family oxidoreductase [Sporolactobacillus spathodeae]|uniref:Sorbitol-6-phosphate 2-dehydrogenase n=1 Tax=Sporolactobacillus spathodeae TaxID=1465502 RepID=A0ABS2Q9H1_9BACL|nr:SDR family oxidoreductase [Sporolactobacillus spathodeae]MBM7658448.1 sorbitol-6-phosphate 2-dehydrogenase [Sporolactobacillus spathodeae]